MTKNKQVTNALLAPATVQAFSTPRVYQFESPIDAVRRFILPEMKRIGVIKQKHMHVKRFLREIRNDIAPPEGFLISDSWGHVGQLCTIRDQTFLRIPGRGDPNHKIGKPVVGCFEITLTLREKVLAIGSFMDMLMCWQGYDMSDLPSVGRERYLCDLHLALRYAERPLPSSDKIEWVKVSGDLNFACRPYRLEVYLKDNLAWWPEDANLRYRGERSSRPVVVLRLFPWTNINGAHPLTKYDCAILPDELPRYQGYVDELVNHINHTLFTPTT